MAQADPDHDPCKHPVEIADVRRGMKRRNAMTAGLLGTLLTVLGMVIAVTVYAATISANVTHLQTGQLRDREESEKSDLELKAEMRAERSRIQKTEVRNVEVHERLTRSTTQVETYLKILSERPRSRR